MKPEHLKQLIAGKQEWTEPLAPEETAQGFKGWYASGHLPHFDAPGTRQFITYRLEMGYRHANVPYFTGRHGITPPGGNNGSPADYVCNDGTASASGNCANNGGLWTPDLRRSQALLLGAIMIKF